MHKPSGVKPPTRTSWLQRVFGHPAIMLPMCLGTVGLTNAWMTTGSPATGMIVGTVGLLSATMIAAYRLLIKGVQIKQEEQTEYEQRCRVEEQAALQDLIMRLGGIEGGRLADKLDQILVLKGLFEENHQWLSEIDKIMAIDVQNHVQQNIKRLIEVIERAYQLSRKSSWLTGEPREIFKESLETILRRVHQEIQALTKVHAEVQKYCANKQVSTLSEQEPEDSLSRLREMLAMAERTQAELSEITTRTSKPQRTRNQTSTEES